MHGPPRMAITLPPATLAASAGNYTLGPVSIVVQLQDGKLLLQLPNQKPLETLPMSEREFFLTAADVRVLFTRNEQGGVASLTLRQFGRDQVAMRQP